jgi:hypothetical protein
MTEIGITSPSDGPKSGMRQTVAGQGQSDFRAMLDERISASGQAAQFGAYGMFAPDRSKPSQPAAALHRAGDVSGISARPAGSVPVRTGTSLLEAGSAASQEGASSPASVAANPVMAAATDAGQGAAMQLAGSGFAGGNRGPASGRITPAAAGRAAPPRSPVSANRPGPAALTLSVTDDAAQIVMRGDLVPAEAMARLRRILEGSGLKLAALCMNGQFYPTGYSRTEGGKNGHCRD